MVQQAPQPPPGARRVACQGMEGCYSEYAARQCFAGQEVFMTYHDTYEQVLVAVEEGTADVAILPIENTLSGTFYSVYDKLVACKLHITAEFCTHDDCCLLALPGVEIGAVRNVLSHSQILERCERTLKTLNAHATPMTDTAEAAYYIHHRHLTNSAAIASGHVAERYGLQILARDIDDDPASSTRYLLLEREARALPAGLTCKTSLAIAVRNNPGSLFRALAAFALRGINVSKLDSRPSARSGSLHTTSRPWEYINFVDIAGSPQVRKGVMVCVYSV
eukprot:comp14552_c0_seq2/m.10789 comp14552_c0_seq2/g.10789  ORF comp14552_c0_seq2/g.10789 comp14552_c0_seq2/m.10789 type:complete len:278 (-) comp14552_c0_seq2:42-875(-)